jgi:MYXO-CTERM domain-containing protein
MIAIKWNGSALLFALIVIMAVPATADAHLRMTSPASRYGDMQKQGPCGITDGARSTNIYTAKPGSDVMLIWDEYISHPGHFRISFDDDGVDDFVDPIAFDDLNTAPSVLVDGIPHVDGSPIYNYMLTLPNVECTNCTLQIIQMMTDKPPYGDGNDIYYQCIDLVLDANAPDVVPDPDAGPDVQGPDAGPDVDPDPDPDPDNMNSPVTGGCSVGGSQGRSTLLTVFAIFGLAALRRRKEY